MKNNAIRILNLFDLVEILTKPAKTQYLVAVIDNSAPKGVPIYGKNFFWIPKAGAIPKTRLDIEGVSRISGLNPQPDQQIVILNHHDFGISYIKLDSNLEAYEFSHIDTALYRAMLKGDANFISHMLSKTLHQVKVTLKTDGLSQPAIEELKRSHWIFDGLADCNDESTLVYKVAEFLSGGSIVADPKRYRPGDHDRLVKSGITTDQYAVPAIFSEIEIHTGSDIDQTFAKAIKSKTENWKERANTIAKAYEAEVRRAAEENKLRAQGVLLQSDLDDFINKHTPILGYDFNDQPWYPDGRKDIAVIRRIIENGGYGYDAIYLVWVDEGIIKFKELVNSSLTKKYLFIQSVTLNESGVVVWVSNGSSYEVSWLDIAETLPPDPVTKEGATSNGYGCFCRNVC